MASDACARVWRRCDRESEGAPNLGDWSGWTESDMFSCFWTSWCRFCKLRTLVCISLEVGSMLSSERGSKPLERNNGKVFNWGA
jgi:hypothetical protein